MEMTLYKLLSNKIVAAIEDGTYPPGSKIPSENELCELFEVSKTTASNALRLLIKEGFVYSIPKIGCFVTENTGKKFSLHYNPFHILQTNPYSLVKIERSREDPNFEEILSFSLLVEAQKQPFCLMNAWVGLHRAAELNGKSMQNLNFATIVFDHHDMLTTRKHISVSALAADAGTASFLGIEKGSPVLCTQVTYTNHDGIMVASAATLYPPDKMELLLTELPESP